MNDNLKHQIEAFLGDTMSPEEATAFVALMEQDPQLRDEVRLSMQINHHLRGDTLDDDIPNNQYTRELMTFFESEEAKGLKAKLRKVESEYHSENKKPSGKRKRYLFAAVLTFFIISTLGVLLLSPNSAQELYASYYTSEDIPSVITRDTDVTALQNGATAFKNGDYNLALEELNEYISTEEIVNPSVYIYTGLSNAELGEYEAALMELDKLINSNALDRSKGLWFKALVYLKMDDKKSAKNTLKKLTENLSNFNYTKAEKLLAEL